MSESHKAGPSFGMQRELAIYAAGAAKQMPAQHVLIQKLRQQAETVLDAKAYGYLEGGAGSEQTMRANVEAFYRWRIVPRMLRGISHPDPRIELLGRKLPTPLLLAPIGVQSILHPEAELAVARAASSLDVPIVLSTCSSKTLEEVSEAMNDRPRWFQLYWSKSPEFTTSLLGRAERAGYSALVVTLDTLQLGWRPRDLDNGYLPFFEGAGLANYFSDPVFCSELDRPPHEDLKSATRHFARIFCDTTLTWDSLRFLREHTKLPILLKGIVHPDDASKAVDHGMDGVIVSNHGGRQVDGSIGALEALHGVVEAVGDTIPVLFDSGIRQGADLFKALALGAKACLLGRPYAYGLAVRGEEGVRDVLHNLLAEFDLTMSLAGCGSIAEITRTTVVREPER